MTGARATGWAGVGRRLGGLAVAAAAAALVIGGIRTSLAEVTASTSSTGLFSAGSVELEQAGESVELLFDEDLLYPGVVAEACVEIVYRGSVAAEVRVFAQPLGGTGLDQYVRFELWTTARPCAGDAGGRSPLADTVATGQAPLFDETLRSFWERHEEYGSGLVLGAVERDQTVTMVARAELLDAADAAGRYTDFAVVVEARP